MSYVCSILHITLYRRAASSSVYYSNIYIYDNSYNVNDNIYNWLYEENLTIVFISHLYMVTVDLS